MFAERIFETIFIAQTRFARILRRSTNSNKAAIIFPLVLLILVTLGCRMLQSSPHKTDAQLTAEFQKNKEKFNQLVRMVQADKKTVSAASARTGKIDGLSQSRVEDYKKLLESLNLLAVIPTKSDTGSVTKIYFNSTDYEKKGEYYYCKYTEDKGFMWYETGKQPANREVRNLDREYIKGKDVKAESRIDDNWSLYYSYETCVKD